MSGSEKSQSKVAEVAASNLVLADVVWGVGQDKPAAVGIFTAATASAFPAAIPRLRGVLVMPPFGEIPKARLVASFCREGGDRTNLATMEFDVPNPALPSTSAFELEVAIPVEAPGIYFFEMRNEGSGTLVARAPIIVQLHRGEAEG